MKNFINRFPMITMCLLSVLIILLVNSGRIYDKLVDVNIESDYDILQEVETSDKGYKLTTYIREDKNGHMYEILSLKLDYGTFKEIDSLKCVRYTEAKQEIKKLEYLNNKKCN